VSPSLARTTTWREEQRNRLLRRADWRFLLPEVNPGKTICFAKGSIAEAARSVSNVFADAAESHGDEYDLAVALDPQEETIRKAFASLRPGGAFYVEWRFRRNRGLGSIRRRLVGAGFRDVSLYWPRPDPEVAPATIWLSLECPDVLRYYLDHRPPARSPARKLARAARRKAFLPWPRFRVASPISSIAVRPGGESADLRSSNKSDRGENLRSEGSSGILYEIRDGWARWGLGATPEGLSMLLLTRGQRASGKAVALVFAPGQARPVLAVKMPRVSESVAVLRREVGILHALGGHARIRDSVPRVLTAGETPSGYLVVETAIGGLPAFVAVSRRNFREIAHKAAEWLARLAGCPEPQPRSQWWPRLVEPLLADFQDHFGRVVEPDLLVECRRILNSIGTLPLVWEQRDFSPWNVFVDRVKGVAAVDWESAEPNGLPLLDLVYFLTYLSFSIDHSKRTGRFLESYRAFLDPKSFTGRIAKECIDRYSKDVGFEAASYRPLRILTWLLHSRSEHAQLVADAGAQPSKGALQQALFFRLWREEICLSDRT
jgi:hypothetical protein